MMHLQALHEAVSPKGLHCSVVHISTSSVSSMLQGSGESGGGSPLPTVACWVMAHA